MNYKDIDTMKIGIFTKDLSLFKKIKKSFQETNDCEISQYQKENLFLENKNANYDLLIIDTKQNQFSDLKFSCISLPYILLTDETNIIDIDEIESDCLVDIIEKNSLGFIDYLTYLSFRIIKNKNIKILIAEDSILSREMLKFNLSRLQFQIIEAANGTQALEKLNSEINLIITDYWMPEMNGDELISRIRTKYNRNDLSIMVISSLKDKNRIPRFLKLGANDYIEKPYTYEELMTRVHNLIDNREAYEITQLLANTDSMTQLFNRRYYPYFLKHIYPKIQKQNQKLYCIMLDIDFFKKINDNFGHDAGDHAIKAVSSALKSHFPSSRSITARWGGEEFLVFLWDFNDHEVIQLCEDYRVIIDKFHFTYHEQMIHFTISLGCAGQEENESVDSLIARADKLLYQSKTSGRNRVTHSFIK